MNGKTCKFGGTSLSDERALNCAEKIVREDSDRRFIVVSAPGRRFETDEKTTDVLARCYFDVLEGNSSKFEADYASVEERFEHFKKKISPAFVKKESEKARRQILKARNYAFTLSRGEYLSARFTAEAFGCAFADAKDGVFLSGGLPAFSSEAFFKRLSKTSRVVIPGFYGYERGAIALLPRGGGDITGAFVARRTHSLVYEIFTDANGVMSADPRIVPHARTISALSRREMNVLARSGANVLQENALSVLSGTRIPVSIKNTFSCGTGTIVKTCLKEGERKTPAGVAGKELFERGFVTVVGKNLGNSMKEALIREKFEFQMLYEGETAARCVVKRTELHAAIRVIHAALFENPSDTG